MTGKRKGKNPMDGAKVDKVEAAMKEMLQRRRRRERYIHTFRKDIQEFRQTDRQTRKH